jgi:hypothetical protein
MNEPVIGQNPLPSELQDKVYELVSHINRNYNIEQGETALFWGLSYYIANCINKDIH